MSEKNNLAFVCGCGSTRFILLGSGLIECAGCQGQFGSWKHDNKYKGMGYDEKHDAHYDPKTLEWVENKCSDDSCDYCKNRPDKHYPPLRSVR